MSWRTGLPIGFVPGFISDHSYMQAPGEKAIPSCWTTPSRTAAASSIGPRGMPTMKPCSSKRSGARPPSVQVMATEYNSVYTDPGKQSTSLVNGLFVAESLGSLLDSGYSGGFVWDLRNGWSTAPQQQQPALWLARRRRLWAIGRSDVNSPPATGPYVAYPGYYALQLASKIIQSGGQVVSAASNYGDLDVYAVKEPSGDLDLLVINANPAASLTEQFDLTGFQPGGAVQVWQYGKTQDTAQSQSPSGGVGPGGPEHDFEPEREQFQLRLSRLFDDRSRSGAQRGHARGRQPESGTSAMGFLRRRLVGHRGELEGRSLRQRDCRPRAARHPRRHGLGRSVRRRDIDLDGVSPSLAAVTFSGAGGSIAQGSGGSLLLNNGPSPATLTVSAGTYTISAR